MTDEPASPISPAEAQGRLDAVSSDPAWRERFFAGDAEARREFASLTGAVAADDGSIANALSDTPTPDPEWRVYAQDELPSRDLASVVEDFRLLGIPDRAIEDLLTGRPLPREEYVAAQRLLFMRMGDKGWRERLLAGGAAEKREMMLIGMITVGHEGPR